MVKARRTSTSPAGVSIGIPAPPQVIEYGVPYRPIEERFLGFTELVRGEKTSDRMAVAVKGIAATVQSRVDVGSFPAMAPGELVAFFDVINVPAFSPHRAFTDPAEYVARFYAEEIYGMLVGPGPLTDMRMAHYGGRAAGVRTVDAATALIAQRMAAGQEPVLQASDAPMLWAMSGRSWSGAAPENKLPGAISTAASFVTSSTGHLVIAGAVVATVFGIAAHYGGASEQLPSPPARS